MPEDTDTVHTMEDIVSICEANIGSGSRSSSFARGVLEMILDHKETQERFNTAMEKYDAAGQVYTDFHKGPDTDDIAKGLRCMLDSNRDVSHYLSKAIRVNEKLLSGAAKITAKIRALKVAGDLPGTDDVLKYMTEHAEAYSKNKSALTVLNERMNSLSEMKAPGEDYGLKPFDDIMLDYNGQVLVWNEEDLDWELADDMHPCRKVPGSAWGKMIYDRSTPGSFFSKRCRSTVEWSNVAPARRLVEDLHDVYTHALPVQRRNRQLAADTGINYPVHDTTNMERELVDYDVEKLVNEPFVRFTRLSYDIHPAADNSQGRWKHVTTPERHDHLNYRVMELTFGVLPPPEEVQVHDRMKYTIPK
uniref:Mating type protein n=1 Tax=Leptographium lundbergii TaxID=96373 RepID=M4PLV6_9PEZI|nr:mating type protein [Leptographium lundbergii]